MKKLLNTRRNFVVQVLSSLLLLFFVHTVINQLFQIHSLNNMLQFYVFNTSLIFWLIIFSEVLIAALLFMPRLRLLGFMLTIAYALLLANTIYRTPHFPHDFGGIINSLTKQQQYILCGSLCLIPIIGIAVAFTRRRKPASEPETQQAVFT